MPAIVFASDVEAHPSYGPQIASADEDHLPGASGSTRGPQASVCSSGPMAQRSSHWLNRRPVL